jgi:hypothetical protein
LKLIQSLSRSIQSSLFLLSIFVLVGCASPPRHFELAIPASSVVFPPPPNEAKIAHVGTIIGESNLVRDITDTTPLKKIAAFIIGLPRTQKTLDNVVRPVATAVDTAGVVYVVDGGKKAVLRIDTFAGTASWITVASPSHSFESPVAVAAIWDNQIAISDSSLGRVFIYDAQGNYVSNMGYSLLQRPVGLVYDQINDQLLVADSLADNIKVFDRAGVIQDVIGSSGTEAGQFNGPTYLAYKAPWLAVSDTLNARIQLINRESDEVRTIGKRGLIIGDFVRPKGVAFDSDYNVYAIESYHDYLLIYNIDGAFLMALGGSGQQHGQFNLPGGLNIDTDDKIYLSDTLNGRVELFQYLGGQP